MPGMLSKMFEPDANGDSEQSAHSNATDLEGDTAIGAEVTINLHAETAVEYAAGGEEGGWSQATDLSLTLGTDAALGLLTGASFEDAETTLG